MGSLFTIILAGATMATTRTAPRTRAAPTPLGPRGPSHPLHQPARAREGALNTYTTVCSSNAAHWFITRNGGCTERCGAARASQEACGRKEECGVPSVVAIGPFGGRGAPSGGWALTPTHTFNSRLKTSGGALGGRVAKESDGESIVVRRNAGNPGGWGATAVGPPTRGTAMHRWSYRLCAAAGQWGCYAGKFTWYLR